MADINRHYVEKVSNISADPKTGIAKITFAVDGEKGGDVFQMIVPAGYLREMFAQIGERMQKTFDNAGRPGQKGGPRGPANTQFKDLTE